MPRGLISREILLLLSREDGKKYLDVENCSLQLKDSGAKVISDIHISTHSSSVAGGRLDGGVKQRSAVS